MYLLKFYSILGWQLFISQNYLKNFILLKCIGVKTKHVTWNVFVVVKVLSAQYLS